MTIDSVPEPPIAIGFLTVVDRSPQGLVGGYLVLNAHARPLEFHSTVPLRPSRTQEILYGSTLEPYLYGEQIGLTLVKTSKLRPLAVFTDCRPALAVAPHVDIPVWLVLAPPCEVAGSGRDVAGDDQAHLHGNERDEPEPLTTAAESASSGVSGNNHRGQPTARRFDCPGELSAGFRALRCGANRLARAAFAAPTAVTGATAAGEHAEQLARVASALDLSEPFERIRAAIEEAQRGVR